MSMQGIDTILQHLANASGALERSSRPGIKEVKEAAGSAKIAADLLKASEVFLSNGIYVICDEPAGAYVDPASHKIEMPEIREELVAELLPLPDLLGDFCQLHPELQLDHFDALTEKLWASVEHGPEDDDPASEWSTPWWDAFNLDRPTAYVRLVYALQHRQPASTAYPTDEEMATWRAQFAQPLPPLPEELGLFATWDEADQLEEFDRRLEDLAEGLDAHVYPPWEQAWEADRLDAFTRLLVAEAREPKTFAVPTDEERDAWLAWFAPAPEAAPEELPVEEVPAPPTDAMQLELRFEAMLDQLEELGVEGAGLKRKNWKKAHKAWHLAFAGDAQVALASLEKVLAGDVISWEVPAGKEVA